ncbi:MAG: hypothetical protein FIB04_07185 [Gammaproteobacteria bacterium]|nr:hypothetical protein [Gammaproteobacteria bacterium]
MRRRADTPPVLDEDHAAFIQGGVSVIVATRDPDCVPDVVRGCGCRVSPDRRRVTVLVEPGRAGSLLEDIQQNGMIAAVFSLPSTHRTIQLKGSDAKIVRVTRADREVAAQHLEEWVKELVRIGYDGEFARIVHGRAASDMVAIAFTPTAAFQQTPGPGAGERLGS